MKTDTLHLKAPGNWINDPNGFIYYKGKYHLFYQHFPYAPVWGTMHWGHAVSGDLIHWEHLGVALFPTKAYDQNGIFSGSAIQKDGDLYLYYTGVRYLEPDAENIHVAEDDKSESCQAFIRSKDGYHFDNWKDKEMMIPVYYEREKDSFSGKMRKSVHVRDPKVWKKDGRCYMILGSTSGGQTGRVLFYQSEDARNWSYVSMLEDAKLGTFLECPDLFSVNGQYLFMGSVISLRETKQDYGNHAICMAAEFVEDTCTLSLGETYQYVDYGLDLYAPQTALDAEGRRTMIAWMRMPEPVEPAGEAAWRGMMCLPRLVEYHNGHISFPVHPNVDEFYSKRLPDWEAVDFSRPYRLKFRLKEGQEAEIGGYKIQVRNHRVHTDRSLVFGQTKELHVRCETPDITGDICLDVFVDRNLIEVFINGGAYVISNIVYGLSEKGNVPDAEIYQQKEDEVLLL